MWIKVLREKTERKYPKFLRMPTEFRSLEFQEGYFDELYSGTANSFNSFASNSGSICLRSNDTVRNIYQTFGTSDFIFIWNKETQEPTTECDFVANIVNVDVQTFTGNAQKTITLFYKINSFYMYGDLAKFDETNVSRIKYIGGISAQAKRYKTEVEKPNKPPSISTEFDSGLCSIVAVVQFYDAEGEKQKRTNHVCIINKLVHIGGGYVHDFPNEDISFDTARKVIGAIENSRQKKIYPWYNETQEPNNTPPQYYFDVIKYYILPKEYIDGIEYQFSGPLTCDLKINNETEWCEVMFRSISSYNQNTMTEIELNNEDIIACGYFGQWLPIEPHAKHIQKLYRKISIDDDLHIIYYLNGTEIDTTTAFEFKAPYTGEDATSWNAKQRAYEQARRTQEDAEFAFKMQKNLQDVSESYANDKFNAQLLQNMGGGIGNAFLSSNPLASLFGSSLKMSGDMYNEMLRQNQVAETNRISNSVIERNLRTQALALSENHPRLSVTPQASMQNVQENANGLLFVTVQSDVNDEFANRYGYETNFIIDGNIEDELRLLIPYPNLQNYVQTKGCAVYGVPYEVAKDIESLFDSGVIIAKNI